jgi:hypothetical protein
MLPCPGAALCSAGSFRVSFPHFTARTAALRRLDAPTDLRFHSARPFHLSAEATRPPRFLCDPLRACRVLRLRRAPRPGHRTSGPHSHRGLLPSALDRASAPASSHFGASSRGPPARCLRFAAALANGPRKTRFQPGGLPFGWSGLSPAGHDVRFQLVIFIASSSPRLSWRTSKHVGSRAGP